MTSRVLAEGSALSEPADPRRSLGNWGERLAENHLARNGIRILERGFRVRSGEIDLIGEEHGELVFVEVRTRSSARFGDPLETVRDGKRRRILRAASCYLQSRSAWHRPCRFDLVAVRKGPSGSVEVEHIRDAFRADD
jgi:putative endonuclease